MSADGTSRGFVFVQPHLKFGGAESQTVAIANALVANGHRCTIVLHRKVGGLLARLDSRVQVIDLGFESHLAVPLGALRVRNVLASIPSSLVVIRLWSSIMMVGSVAKSLKHHRFAFYEDLDPRDHARYIRLGALKQSIIKQIFRVYQKDIVANTRHVARAMVEVYGLRREPKVITCGIDSDGVRVAAGSRQKESAPVLRLVTVGSLTEIKGLRELLWALESMGRRINWTLVGEGPLGTWLDEQKPKLQNVSISLRGVELNPYRVVAASDAMVHGGKSESLGVVILEAIALGVPVVARDANGPREIAEELPDSLLELFNGDDPKSLPAALERVLERSAANPDVLTDLGRFELVRTVEAWEQLHAG